MKIIDVDKFSFHKIRNAISSDYIIPEQVEIIHNKRCNYKCKFCYYTKNNTCDNYLDYLSTIFYKQSYPGLIVRINLNDTNDDILEILKFFKKKNTITIIQVVSDLFLNHKAFIDQYNQYIDIIDVTPTRNVEINHISNFMNKYDYCKVVISLIDKVINFNRIKDLKDGLYHYKPFINKKGELEFTKFNISHLQKHNAIIFSSVFGFENGVKLLPEILVNRKPNDSLIIDLVDKKYYTQYNMINKIDLFKNDKLEEMYKKVLARKSI